MNKVFMMGRLVNEPELKTTPNGITTCRFRIAVDRNYQKKGEEKKSDFFNVIAWRGTAEFINRFFSKGRMIMIEGEMQVSQFTDKNGNPSTWYEIVVENAFFTGEKSNGGGNYGGYNDAPPITEPPAGYGGGYGSSDSYGNSAPASAPAPTPAPDFAAADKDDYPF